MTGELHYNGEDAEEHIKLNRMYERKEDLQDKVEDHMDRVERAEDIVEAVEEALEQAKEARRTEKAYLEQLRDTSVEDFEDIEEVELIREGVDEDEQVDIDDLDFVESGKSFRSRTGSGAITIEWDREY